MHEQNKYFNANKALWNKRVDINYNSEFYANDHFLRNKNSLKSIELDHLGNIKGKNILHLQCHFGQDTLSLVNLGANVTGIDFSDKAIEKAKYLSVQTNLKADFLCSNIYDLKNQLDKKFDIVFTSYGTIGWLPDIDKWAEIVSHFLKPGGKFLIVEFHPIIWMFDENIEFIKYSYFHTDEPIEESAEGTYSDINADINMVEYGWNHTISDVIGSLLDNGLQISSFCEYPYSPFNCFPGMKEVNTDKYVFNHFGNKLPLLYSLEAIKL